MTKAVQNIVTVNAGSSSIKVAVFGVTSDSLELPRLVEITISDIGQPQSKLRIAHHAASVQTEEVHAPDHATASQIVMEKISNLVPFDDIVAIGHRLVHGGSIFTEPVLATRISEDDWKLLAQLDPRHTPQARQLVTQFAQNYPALPQIACFDTAFFHDLPEVAKVIPLPRKYYKNGVRRYGFHGLSYSSLLSAFREKAGASAANGRVILAHLGSGASLAATKQGKPVDTTMSFTPASGITMSTRSGDLDPTIFTFLDNRTGMSADTFDHMVNFESGLLGVSGVTGDLQALLGLEAQNKDAALAVELFVHDAKKAIGALAATLGGVDSLIFSGGIGEQSAVIRARICAGLEFMGITIDETANQKHHFLISAEQSKAGVHVIPTNEALVIAEQTITALGAAGKE